MLERRCELAWLASRSSSRSERLAGCPPSPALASLAATVDSLRITLAWLANRSCSRSERLAKAGAKGGSRTPKAFRPPDPKSGASASSATFARGRGFFPQYRPIRSRRSLERGYRECDLRLSEGPNCGKKPRPYPPSYSRRARTLKSPDRGNRPVWNCHPVSPSNGS